MLPIGYQRQVYSIFTNRRFADPNYFDTQVLEFTIKIPPNHYMNFNSVHICPPIWIKSKADNNNQLPARMVMVSNFSALWLKEVDIKRYGGDLQILPIGNTTELYKYSDEILEHMPKDSLKTFENTLLYFKKKFVLEGNSRDRSQNNVNDEDDRSDPNLTERITKFRT